MIIICCSMCAWYITRVHTKVTKTIYVLCLFSMIVPFQMVMFTLSKFANLLENERGMEATREIFRSIPEGASIGVMIGPEGGFSPEEIAQLDKDMHRISLGRRILRTETAGMATLSMLIYELDI